MIDHLITAAGHTAIESLYHKWRSSSKSRQGGVLLRDSLNLITQIRNENLVSKGATRQDAVNLIRDVLEDLRKPNLALYDLHKRNPENFSAFMEMIAKADYDLRGRQMTHMQINIILQGLIADFGLHLIYLRA